MTLTNLFSLALSQLACTHPGLRVLPFSDDLGALHHVLARAGGDAVVHAPVACGGVQVTGQA